LPSVRTRQFALRASAAAALTAVALLLAVPLPHAVARTTSANSLGYTISITSMTPSYAGPNSTIRVSGTLTNRSGQPAPGLSVQLLTTTGAFSSSSQMDSFGSDPAAFSTGEALAEFQFASTVNSGATVQWTASFSAADAGFSSSSVAVYGVEAAAVSPIQGTLAAEGTYLPYWPSSGVSTKMKIAWVWPLIDTPRETVCANTLTDDSLDESMSSSGRLGTLLSTGLSYASSAHLTWAVDPELLNEAKTMSGVYYTGGSTDCVDRPRHTASAAARSWLASLTTDTASDPMFVTPYADVDVSALSHAGLDDDLKTAYSLGNSTTTQTLNRTFESVSWPADGIADTSVLDAISQYGDATTVVLNSDQMPLTDGGYDDAVASVTTGVGDTLHVLLANNAITSVLDGASSRSASGEFATVQDYLAETAMIAAEAPSLQRTIVVTPPREWDPTESVADTLLNDTTNTPWLEPVSLSEVAAGKSASDGTRAQVGDRVVPSNELSAGYLNNVKQAGASLATYQSLLSDPGPDYLERLNAAVAATESSAWRGNTTGGQTLLNWLQGYLTDTEQKIEIVLGNGKVTLAGKSGSLPVSVFNGTDQSIQVKVLATSTPGRLTVSGDDTVLTIGSHLVGNLRLSLNSLQIGTTQVKLELVTADNSPIPVASKSINVVSTLYGRAVLVLIIVAIAIVVLTSATRWLRRWVANGGNVAGSGEGSETEEDEER
jgi:Family of unknown function (DUF6049)